MDKTKVYGIQFDEAVPRGGEQRILDAENMKNDYVVGSEFQLNGGSNDFDKAYPFGAMRLCNVSVVNGERRVVYANEPGFTRTGENGNVMVEIPKFYSKREKSGTVERWMISGTKHPGFELEPVFTRGDRELDVIYVGSYNIQNRGNGLFSSTGGFPDVCKGAADFRKEITEAGYDPYDLAVYLCLQKLIVIEFGTRYVKQHLGGIGFLRYASKVTPKSAIQAMGPGYITINAIGWGDHFAPGHEIGVGRKEHDPNYIHRTITKMEVNPENSEWLDIYYAGEDLQGIVEPINDAAFGIPQKNGLADGISYHTGRGTLKSLSPETEYLVNAFQYRGIENVWGNVWENLAGLRIRSLHYSYTFDPELYDEESDKWKKVSYQAPCQHYLTAKATNLWIDSMGYDPEEPLLLLPQHSVGDDKQFGNYYDSVVYAYLDKNYADAPVDLNTEFGFSVGGGFDHSVFGSLFTYRGFMAMNSGNWLYSNRICLRK